MYDLYVKPEADKIFQKLARKDSKQLASHHDSAYLWRPKAEEKAYIS